MCSERPLWPGGGPSLLPCTSCTPGPRSALCSGPRQGEGAHGARPLRVPGRGGAASSEACTTEQKLQKTLGEGQRAVSFLFCHVRTSLGKAVVPPGLAAQRGWLSGSTCHLGGSTCLPSCV